MPNQIGWWVVGVFLVTSLVLGGVMSKQKSLFFSVNWTDQKASSCKDIYVSRECESLDPLNFIQPHLATKLNELCPVCVLYFLVFFFFFSREFIFILLYLFFLFLGEKVSCWPNRKRSINDPEDKIEYFFL